MKLELTEKELWCIDRTFTQLEELLDKGDKISKLTDEQYSLRCDIGNQLNSHNWLDDIVNTLEP